MKTRLSTQLLTAILPLAAVLLTIAPAHAQLSVQWLTQYGTFRNDVGYGIAVDVLGQSWVAGDTGGDFGGTTPAVADLFLSRLSASGSVDFTQQRGGTGDVSGVFGNVVALVGSGTVFVGGYTSSSAIDGQVQIGDADAVAVRYDTSGTWQGTTRFGSSGEDQTYALAGNATNLLVAGITVGSFDGQTNAGSFDAFLSKRDSTGAVVWTRFAGTSGFDESRGAAFDSVGNGYLAGSTAGSFSGFTNAGSYDLFLTRYDPAGNQTLLRQIGTNSDDFTFDVKVDVNGNIYVTGRTAGSLGGQTNHGENDAFVMKLDSNGNVLWTRLFGGSGSEVGNALGLDGAGHVWIAGSSNMSGSPDAFVAEYDSTGLLLGTTVLSSSGDDFINGLSIGADGAAYVTGGTYGALGGPNAGNVDVFVAKITGVPEPSAALLLAGGGAGLLLRRRRA